ncbi:MAG: aspartate kinase [Bacteroidales bacterium]|nr:aspartate kinase [Bacteroidales bacterium]
MYRVLKFGGSSVAGATQVSRVLDIVEREALKGRVILVSSAIAGCTDALLSGYGEQLQELEHRHADMVRRLFTGADRESLQRRLDGLFQQMRQAPADERVTFGEIFSTTLLAAKLETEGYRVLWLDSRELVVKADEPESFKRIRAAVEASDAEIFVAPGFICRDASGKISTLGRGGSDYSAALYAAAVQADSLQIWTDVPGIMTANPKQVPAARTVPRMSYAAALDMASHGAKVLYAPTVAPAMAAGIDIEIRNTFAPDGKYTVIGAEADAARWIGVASEGGCIRLVGAAGHAGGNTPSVAKKKADAPSGVSASGQADNALQQAGIQALSISEDGSGVDIEVKEAVLDQALRAIHRAFFQELPVQEVNLFIAGDGAVAKALIQLIQESASAVKERSGKTLRVVGRANSRRYGIDLGGAPVIGLEGDYIDAILQVAPKGSLFIDATNSKTLYKRYTDLLQAGIGIVSSNRRSFAVPYADYAAMVAAARENGVPLRYETTVGAALPILESIARGANSCNEVLSIEAVVSCTLNQILSDYKPGGPSFASLVRRAAAEGLTEPDPRVDLGGRDALRKLLILAREAGVQLEESAVQVEPVVPPSVLEGSLEQFYAALEAYEPKWAEKAQAVAFKGFRQRFVACLEKSARGYRASIALKEVAPEHPAYYLRGTENAIIVRSAFHPYPLVIQGPGEGAREAASSILNDILR